MLVRSELYYKVGIGVCAASTVVGLIIAVMGASWGILQITVSVVIGLLFYRDLLKLQALTDAGETADKPPIFFEQDRAADREQKEVREQLRQMGIRDDDVKMKSTMGGTYFEPKTPEAREKLTELLLRRYQEQHQGETKDPADK
jgi:hypothetical protein